MEGWGRVGGKERRERQERERLEKREEREGERKGRERKIILWLQPLR